MKNNRVGILLTIFLCMAGTKAFAYDFAEENADGVTIYYNYINDNQELEVTFRTFNNSFYRSYSGDVIIPEEVTYMNRTRKVTSIGENAFRDCSELTSVTIPNSVTSIGYSAFYLCSGLTTVIISNSVTSIEQSTFAGCTSLTSVTIPNSVTNIGEHAFDHCKSLTSITIPDCVKSIAQEAFIDCSGLTTVTIGNSVTSIGKGAFYNCSGLTTVTIGNNVTSIGESAFALCSELTSVNIPNGVTTISDYTFWNCNGLTSVIIPNSVITIGNSAFAYCSGLTSVTIPNSVTTIGGRAFEGWDLPEVISMIVNPFNIADDVFNINTFNNATLYVPKGTIDKYKAKEGWKKFIFIEEGDGSGNTPTETKKCEKPTISYKNGLLTYHCATEDAICQSTITDTDIKSYSGNEVQLSVTYEISVYATKAGYENSETATATLCWIDVEPKTEGIENGIAHVRANAILIQTENGQINISGANDGTKIYVYGIDGQQIGSSMSYDGRVSINTNLQSGSLAIIKIGDRSVKVVIQ